MPQPARFLELRCPDCLWKELCGPEAMITWLRQVGKVRPGRQMELEILYEVFRASAQQFCCPRCGRQGLAASCAPAGHEWSQEGVCAKCGRPIGKERLQAVPGVTCCALCQRDEERGVQRSDRDFCPRCGAPLEVRAVFEGRRTRYVLKCSARPPCPL